MTATCRLVLVLLALVFVASCSQDTGAAADEQGASAPDAAGDGVTQPAAKPGDDTPSDRPEAPGGDTSDEDDATEDTATKSSNDTKDDKKDDGNDDKAEDRKPDEPAQKPDDAKDETKEAKQPELPKWPTHDHAAFKERSKERATMVRTQIEAGGVEDKPVLEAMRTVPRHAFVRADTLGRAYDDAPLPIGLGQTISQPFVVGYMTEKLKLGAKDRVLEIGTGSGYQAAVCAEIAAEVFSIEILKTLGDAAATRLKELGYRNVTTQVADGYHGWEDKGPFDAIIVTAAAQHVPPPLVKQLKPGGRMILPVGGPFAVQYLVLVNKDDKGKVSSKTLLPVRFVPLTRTKEE